MTIYLLRIILIQKDYFASIIAAHANCILSYSTIHPQRRLLEK